MTKIFEKLKGPFVFWCIVYALTTLASSTIQLLNDIPNDTNFHIINRAVIVLIGAFIFVCLDRVVIKNQIITTIIVYIISMLLVYSYIWLTSIIEPLHPNAFRDITLNFTPLYIIIAIFVWFKKDRRKNEKSN